MKKSKFSEQQIVSILQQGQAGVAVNDICREHAISKSTYYKWKAKYGGMEVSELARMRKLETENARLKAMYADLSLDHRVLKEALEKSGDRWTAAANGTVGHARTCFE